MRKKGQYTIDLIGNATNEYTAKIEVDLSEIRQQYTLLSKDIFDQEIEQYSKLQAEVQSYLKMVL